MKASDLEERLVSFTVSVIKLTDKLPDYKAADNLAGQMVRSSTSVSLNYGEAQAGESRKDFIHKMRIVLKELKETRIGLDLIKKMKYLKENAELEKAFNESNELIAIFTASINTARKKL